MVTGPKCLGGRPEKKWVLPWIILSLIGIPLLKWPVASACLALLWRRNRLSIYAWYADYRRPLSVYPRIYGETPVREPIDLTPASTAIVFMVVWWLSRRLAQFNPGV